MAKKNEIRCDLRNHDLELVFEQTSAGEHIKIEWCKDCGSVVTCIPGQKNSKRVRVPRRVGMD